MVLADADSWQNRRPDFVTHGFQLIACAIDPGRPVGNLLAKDRSRRHCSDKVSPCWPEISSIVEPRPAPPRSAREGRARAGASPDWAIPTCDIEGIIPSANAGEEMHSLVAGKVIRSNIDN